MENTLDLPIDKFSSTYFSGYDIENSLEVLKNLELKNEFLSKSYLENVWIFAHELSPGRSIKLDYGKIKIYVTDENLILIKLWIASMLSKYKPSTVIYYFHHFSIAVKRTHFFSEEHLNSFIDWLHQDNLSNNRKTYLIATTLNFFEFSDHPNISVYVPRMYELRKKIRFKSNSIQLPSSKNILNFSYCLEDYFRNIERNKSYTEKEKLQKKILYYPILIWWKLTTIIPMRSTEFCIIKRNCLEKVNDDFFINITRIKIPLNKTTPDDYYTKIEINEELYQLINKYVSLTDPFGETETLISYNSLIQVDYTNQRKIQKSNKNYFNKNNLDKLLGRFYKEVVNSIYKINVPPHQKLSPNDTRHIAFVSLMMQGISPIEIARLGGHKTIAAQYHYSFHTEYWIDSEVFKLINTYKTNEIYSKHYIEDKIKLMAFNASKSAYKASLPIGYCTDPLVRCEASECMLCIHWGIELKELESNSEIINEKISKKKNSITELMNFIYNIQTRTSLKPSNSAYLKNEEDLQNKLKKVDSELRNLAVLSKINKGTLKRYE